MTPLVRVQLSTMMFLQFFVWGAWYGQMSKYLVTQLQATGDQVGSAYAAFSLAMVVAPFFIGMLADRYFAAQKVLGVLNLLGAALLFWLTQIRDAEVFYWVMLLYCLTFAPCIALTSSIALRQVKDGQKEFPVIRVFGTISWIVVVNIVGLMGVGDKVTIFQLAMIAAAVLGVYSFFLPDTPPVTGQKTSFAQILGVDAFVLFKDRAYAVFFVSSILICIPLSFYYTWANPSLTASYMSAFTEADPASFNIENKMSLGQASEVIFMLLLPLAYRRLGVKNILIIGLLAWIIRFLFFGYGSADVSEWMLYSAILLHGVCYDFFFVTGFIYSDQKAGSNIKSQAQALITLATYGIGMYIGSKIAGRVYEMVTKDGIVNWTDLWLVPAAIAFVVLIIFVLFFREKKEIKTAV